MHGIDYGHGQTNRHPETGICFGYIPWHDLDPEVSSEIDMQAHAAWAEDPDNDPEGDGPEGTPTGYVVHVDHVALMPLTDGVFVIASNQLAWDGSYCSPCAPGAVDLPSCKTRGVPVEDRPEGAVVAYDVPADWLYVP